MGATGSFPIDLILLGMIAAFLVLRLRSVLGKRTGFERPPATPDTPMPSRVATPGPIIEGRAEPMPPPIPPRSVAMPDASTPAGQALAAMRGIDRGFEPAGFLTGAEKAFRMIVQAFASGDRILLRQLLSDDTYGAFEQAIAAREAANHTQVSEIRGIEAITIEGATLRGTVADVTLRIVSDQVNLTRDSSGLVVIGTDAVTEITDLWTFERDLRQPDPTWRLVAARSA